MREERQTERQKVRDKVTRRTKKEGHKDEEPKHLKLTTRQTGVDRERDRN